MNRVSLAFKVFFGILFNKDRAEQIRKIEAVSVDAVPEPKPAHTPAPAPPPPAPTRSEALSLLETLQREARLIDFLQEEIDSYSDEQVGSAVREIHRSSRAVLKRMFDISPVLSETEGSRMTVQSSDSAARIRLVGKVTETRPVTGTIVHGGWKVEKCELPKWSGTPDSAKVIAPAEVEL
ncbi:DUF2760 domain-containing protein [Planctomicrobium sp. SH668]|uniref:DUF2760 domain-containing protein n=1 Tax=Planctomicrobium sp. SH668 TaxID=3448126 RepID=UPI003F5C6D35